MAFVAAQIVWDVSTVPTDCADQGDSGALLVVASLGLFIESEALMAYTTTMMSGAAFDVRIFHRTDAAALLLSSVVFNLGDALLTPASIRDDAVHLC